MGLVAGWFVEQRRRRRAICGCSSRPASWAASRPSRPSRSTPCCCGSGMSICWRRSMSAARWWAAIAGLVAGPLDHEDGAGVTRQRLRRRRRRRRRRRPDVRHPRRPARPAGAAARPRRQGRQEDPDLGRRALQLHQPRERGPRRSSRPIRISASRRWRATPSTISSPWSTSTASPGTRRRWASCSATARRGRSWPCCWPNATRPASTCGSAHRITGDREGRPFHRAHRPGRLRPRPSLVLATGGLSIPKMGATGFAHDIAAPFRARDDRDAAGAGAVHARRCRS